jgi:hypothetical protein
MHIFLDDYRIPSDVTWCNLPNEDWTIVRSYEEFVKVVKEAMEHEVDIDFIAFDHDLADAHYKGDFSNPDEKTGMDCAKWLALNCIDSMVKIPDFVSHSLNPVGRKNITEFLESARRYMDDDAA